MARYYLLVAIAILILIMMGCATAPKHYDFDPVCSIQCRFDEAWAALVEYFAVSGLPIDTIEKDSGLIITFWMDASGNGRSENKMYCDCGGAGIATQHWTRGKFNVFVKELPDDIIDLRVTCQYQQRRSLMDADVTIDCVSTGNLEKSIHNYVIAKVQGSDVPDTPYYNPAKSD
jgi:hypothetical protein